MDTIGKNQKGMEEFVTNILPTENIGTYLSNSNMTLTYLWIAI